MESTEIVDVLYRSRITLLDHLEESGYDTTKYRKFSPKEIHEMVKAGIPQGSAIAPALQMELVRKEDSSNGPEKCLVVYALNRIKQKLDPVVKKIITPEDESFDTSTTELIIVTIEPIAPNFHKQATDSWIKHKARVRFFQAAAIINNPLKHFLVPKHEIMPAEEHEAFLKEMFATKFQLPRIKFHEDPIARMIGLVPGDIVKITRPSPTAGECIVYRVCVP